jgi:UDP-N-acetylglucosamine 4,6-dehydratase
LQKIDWQNTSVLITGGTGSFGKKFVQVMLETYRPRRLAVLSRDEIKQSEMKKEYSESQVRYFLGDVRDSERLHRAFRGVDIVVHAAALKQVPAAEADPFEAVQTNILGGKNVIDAAIDCGVKRVLALSTDKAVGPVNLYGATKLVAEKLFVQGNAYAGGQQTRLAVARYGNVIGSRGSVVPLFMEQRKTGVVTVTDPRMTRFWITLDQGVKFVIRSLERMKGGEVFVPKLPSMKILDLVEAVAPGCKVDCTGIRPGEKIHESLISEDESNNVREHDEYYVVVPAYHSWTDAHWTDGRPAPDRFSYRSDSNPHQLSIQELRQIAESL